MFRIDSEGATVDNKFTEGNPSTGVPATVVSDDWLNHVQEEIAQFIEYTGATLSKLDDNQLQTALIEFFKIGGRALPFRAPIANNSSSLDLEDANNSNANFEIDTTKIKALICAYTIERKTSTSNRQETGFLHITWDSADSVWRLGLISALDDAGVTFATALVSGNVHKLQYTSDDQTGTTYSGYINAHIYILILLIYFLESL